MVREDFAITEKTLIRDFSKLKAPTNTDAKVIRDGQFG